MKALPFGTCLRAILLSALVLASPMVLAQPAEQTTIAEEEAIISITGSITARELTVDEPGDLRIRFILSEGGDTLRWFDRGNLPDPVSPGVTYRDVVMRFGLMIALGNVDLLLSPGSGSGEGR